MQQNKKRNHMIEFIQWDADGNEIRLPFVSVLEESDYAANKYRQQLDLIESSPMITKEDLVRLLTAYFRICLVDITVQHEASDFQLLQHIGDAIRMAHSVDVDDATDNRVVLGLRCIAKRLTTGEFKDAKKDVLSVSVGKAQYLKSFREFLRGRIRQRKRKLLPAIISASTKGGVEHE